jgi:succinate dehydrogenase/fumarate reductase flavoprotein subunit
MAGSWDEEADVVVVGYGGAGASAAIAAHDEGAKVLIDLAGKLGVAEADHPAATLAKYQQACRNGRDDKSDIRTKQ